jgi:hypothetical protein
MTWCTAPSGTRQRLCGGILAFRSAIVCDSYEGKFGLFDTDLQSHAGEVDIAVICKDLGAVWHLADTAMNPRPSAILLLKITGRAGAARPQSGESSKPI